MALTGLSAVLLSFSLAQGCKALLMWVIFKAKIQTGWLIAAAPGTAWLMTAVKPSVMAQAG